MGKEGQLVSLHFTAFEIFYQDQCHYDHLTITDNDGTVLLEKCCGPSTDGNIIIGDESINSTVPANITSNTNSVKLYFRTNNDNGRLGWSIAWTEVTPDGQEEVTGIK